MTNILLVEDDLWLAQLYQDALQADPICRVLHSTDPDSALGILDETEVSLIILDMFLPGHNGIEFLHEIASYEDLNKLPVILLTSVTERDLAMNEERWKHYGVTQYLYKPATKPRDLVAAVKKQLLKTEVKL